MKFCVRLADVSLAVSGPARDLWIEILAIRVSSSVYAVGSRKGPVD